MDGSWDRKVFLFPRETGGRSGRGEVEEVGGTVGDVLALLSTGEMTMSGTVESTTDNSGSVGIDSKSGTSE